MIFHKPMKGMDVSCVSQASTAVCHTATSTTATADRRLSSSSASLSLTIEQRLGGRAIDRHNPIIADSRRSLISLTLPAPCSSSTPINPVPYHQLRPNAKKRNSFSYSSKNEKRPTKQGSCSSPPPNISAGRFSCDSYPVKKKLDPKHEHVDFKSPPGSSRYLLSKADSFEDLSLPHQVVVVLRVSLHCKGCEGKARKHLSRMEGVTSFNIDFAAKKVTIVVDVAPVVVLSSVSRVKKAQFWDLPSYEQEDMRQQ